MRTVVDIAGASDGATRASVVYRSANDSAPAVDVATRQVTSHLGENAIAVAYQERAAVSHTEDVGMLYVERALSAVA